MTLFITGCSQKKYEKNLFYMDTYINISIYANNQNTANDAFKEAEEIYEKYQNLTNIYDQNSELSKINNSTEKSITINKDLKYILNLSHEWLIKSNGYFNINIGELTTLWKSKKNDGVLPTKEELDGINITDFKIIDDKIKNENIYFDLGGVAKGYATEEVGKQLDKMGIDNYLINAGGNILAGNKPGSEKFQIGIENPNKAGEVYEVVKGEKISVVTSGGYERFFEIDEKRYHHIIDPKTKYPSNNMLSATVVTKNSSLADILSTTIFLMNKKDAINLIESIPNTECILYVSDKEIIKSSGFKNYE